MHPLDKQVPVLPATDLASMASTLHLRLQPPLIPELRRPHLKSSFRSPHRARGNPNPSTSSPKRLISAALPSPESSWEREEVRWLREEQRWTREEKRWIREESRWSAERESLLREIAALRRRVESLERERPPPIAAAIPRTVLAEQAEVKEMILEEVRVSETTEEVKGRRILRKGSEGEDVHEMQEALLKLGFYSGEEDMEYSSFSSGTERAVKTWQAAQGTPEDGIMTTELLETLFMEQGVGNTRIEVDADTKVNSVSVAGKDGVNGATVASISEVAEIQRTVVKESGDAKVEVSQQRVFLLGENRWEEPSRLEGRNKSTDGRISLSSTKCLACQGVGRLMCTECDGSGEPNIEPQFLEWVEEGTKCPYCEGVGHTTCDVCDGRGSVQT